MADLKKVKARIREIAQGSRSNVSIEDIEWVVTHLGQNGYETSVRTAGDHKKLFAVGHKRFGVCNHHKGSSQIRPAYVNVFIKAMIELDLYEED